MTLCLSVSLHHLDNAKAKLQNRNTEIWIYPVFSTHFLPIQFWGLLAALVWQVDQIYCKFLWKSNKEDEDIYWIMANSRHSLHTISLVGSNYELVASTYFPTSPQYKPSLFSILTINDNNRSNIEPILHIIFYRDIPHWTSICWWLLLKVATYQKRLLWLK